MEVVYRCTVEGCKTLPSRYGICEFHKWERYRRNVVDRVRKKEIKKMTVVQLRLEKRKNREEKWKATVDKRLGRLEEMFNMYKEGKTLKAIGDVYGVTPERIRQQINQFPDYGKYTKVHRKNPSKYKEYQCTNCKKTILRLISRFGNQKRHYCDQSCEMIWHKKHERTPAEERAFNTARTKSYYHRVLKHSAAFKEKTRLRNIIYSNRRKEQEKRLLEEKRLQLEEKLKENPKLQSMFKKHKNG